MGEKPRRSLPWFDEALAQARAGDREALGRLLSTMGRILKRHAGLEVPDCLAAKVGDSDLFQDLYRGAVRDFKQFRGNSPGEFTAWLLQIMRRNLSDLQRYYDTGMRQVNREVSLDDSRQARAPQAEAADRSPTPSSLLICREEMEAVGETLKRLPPRWRQAIELLTAGHSYEGIGLRLGCSVAAARKICYRVGQQLRADQFLLDAPA